eukprot:Rmarinus@m.28965
MQDEDRRTPGPGKVLKRTPVSRNRQNVLSAIVEAGLLGGKAKQEPAVPDGMEQAMGFQGSVKSYELGGKVQEYFEKKRDRQVERMQKERATFNQSAPLFRDSCPVDAEIEETKRSMSSIGGERPFKRKPQDDADYNAFTKSLKPVAPPTRVWAGPSPTPLPSLNPRGHRHDAPLTASTTLPEGLHVKETVPVFPLNDVDNHDVQYTSDGWVKCVFPTIKPTRRDEVNFLKTTLNHVVSQVIGEQRPDKLGTCPREKGEDFKRVVSTHEQAVWTILQELIRQTSVQSHERGEVLQNACQLYKNMVNNLAERASRAPPDGVEIVDFASYDELKGKLQKRERDIDALKDTIEDKEEEIKNAKETEERLQWELTQATRDLETLEEEQERVRKEFEECYKRACDEAQSNTELSHQANYYLHKNLRVRQEYEFALQRLIHLESLAVEKADTRDVYNNAWQFDRPTDGDEQQTASKEVQCDIGGTGGGTQLRLNHFANATDKLLMQASQQTNKQGHATQAVMKEAITSLGAANQDLRKQLIELEEEKNDLPRRIELLEKDIQRLQRQRDDARAETEELRQQTAEIKESYAIKETEHNDLKTQFYLLEDDVKRKSNKIRSLTENTDRLSKQVKHMNETVNQAREASVKQQKDNAELLTKIHSLEDEVDVLRQNDRVKQLEDRVALEIAKAERLKTLIDGKNRQLHTLQEELDTVQKSLKTRGEELNAVNTRLRDSETLVVERDARIGILEETIESCKRSNQEWADEIAVLRDENIGMMKDIERERRRVAELEAAFEANEKRMDAAHDERAAALRQIEDLQNVIAEHTEKAALIEMKFGSLCNRNMELMDEVDRVANDLNLAREDTVKAKYDLEGARDTILQLEEQLQFEINEKEDLREDVTLLERKVEQYDDDVLVQKAELRKSEQVVRASTAKAEALEVENAELKSELDRITEMNPEVVFARKLDRLHDTFLKTNDLLLNQQEEEKQQRSEGKTVELKMKNAELSRKTEIVQRQLLQAEEQILQQENLLDKAKDKVASVQSKFEAQIASLKSSFASYVQDVQHRLVTEGGDTAAAVLASIELPEAISGMADELLSSGDESGSDPGHKKKKKKSKKKKKRKKKDRSGTEGADVGSAGEYDSYGVGSDDESEGSEYSETEGEERGGSDYSDDGGDGSRAGGGDSEGLSDSARRSARKKGSSRKLKTAAKDVEGEDGGASDSGNDGDKGGAAKGGGSRAGGRRTDVASARLSSAAESASAVDSVAVEKLRAKIRLEEARMDMMRVEVEKARKDLISAKEKLQSEKDKAEAAEKQTTELQVYVKSIKKEVAEIDTLRTRTKTAEAKLEENKRQLEKEEALVRFLRDSQKKQESKFKEMFDSNGVDGGTMMRLINENTELQRDREALAEKKAEIADLEGVVKAMEDAKEFEHLQRVKWEEECRNALRKVIPNPMDRGCQTDPVQVLALSVGGGEATTRHVTRPRRRQLPKFVDRIDMQAVKKHEPKNLWWLVRSIRSIYEEKFVSDAIDTREKRPHPPLPEFIYEYASKKFGVKRLVDQFCWDLFATTNLHKSTNGEVALFGMFMSETYEIETFSFFSYCRLLVQDPPGPSASPAGVLRRTFITLNRAREITNLAFAGLSDSAHMAFIRAIEENAVLPDDINRHATPEDIARGPVIVDTQTFLEQAVLAFENEQIRFRTCLTKHFKGVDRDGDGVISKDEFVELVLHFDDSYDAWEAVDMWDEATRMLRKHELNLDDFLALALREEFLHRKTALAALPRFLDTKGADFATSQLEIITNAIKATWTNVDSSYIQRVIQRLQKLISIAGRDASSPRKYPQLSSSSGFVHHSRGQPRTRQQGVSPSPVPDVKSELGSHDPLSQRPRKGTTGKARPYSKTGTLAFLGEGGLPFLTAASPSRDGHHDTASLMSENFLKTSDSFSKTDRFATSMPDLHSGATRTRAGGGRDGKAEAGTGLGENDGPGGGDDLRKGPLPLGTDDVPGTIPKPTAANGSGKKHGAPLLADRKKRQDRTVSAGSDDPARLWRDVDPWARSNPGTPFRPNSGVATPSTVGIRMAVEKETKGSKQNPWGPSGINSPLIPSRRAMPSD